MKIGIDIRPLQTQQSLNRGIGNYVHNQIIALLESARQEQILLFYDPRLRPPKLLETAPPGSHWCAIPLETCVHSSITYGQPVDIHDDFRQGSILQATLSNYGLDVFHITSPFEWEIAIGPSFDICPMVATLYDLIPLVFAPIYLSPASSEFKELYMQRLRLLTQAKRLMAISDASRRDAIDWLGLSPELIDVVYAGCDERFKPLPNSAIDIVLSRVGLPEKYILAVLGYQYTKNIEGTIAVYSHLPPSLRDEFPLVIVCRLSGHDRQVLEEIARQRGVLDQVVFTGEIPQDDLIALYSGATVFLYPSRYDGFGLPVLEAMRCGAPVVTSTRASLPEVAGEAALFGDPEDHQGLAILLESLLTDPAKRAKMREQGFAQARRFSWQQVARRTLEVYQRAVRALVLPAIIHSSRPRIAYWSPFNPCKSGISDYSEHLLPYLARYFDIDIYVDGYVPASDAIMRHFSVYDYRAYPLMAPQRLYSVNLYQMGNSVFHKYIYEALLSEPGIVVLHDFVLHGLIYSITEAVGKHTQYLDEVEYNEGQRARMEMEQSLQAGDWLRLYFYPMNKRVVDASLGIIVHSQWAQSQLSDKQRVSCPVIYIPHGVKVFPINPKRKSMLRRKLGISDHVIVVSCFGRILFTKRVDVVVQAFSRLNLILPNSVLIFVGEPDSGTASYLLAAQSRLGDCLLVTGYVPESTFEEYLQISDICVNLRYPSAGETSGTLCRAMGAGLPVLTSNLPQFAEFPEDCVWKVDVGEGEEEQLTAYLIELAMNQPLRHRMGYNAQRYIQERATWPKVAEEYARFIEHVLTHAGAAQS